MSLIMCHGMKIIIYINSIQDAQLVIDDIHNRGKIPIVVGGTHYYLQTLLFNNKTIDDSNSI